MGSSSVPRGADQAFRQLLAHVQDDVKQLQRLTPGSLGGGSVAAPFTIGGVTLGQDLALEDVVDLLDSKWNLDFPSRIDQGVSTNITKTWRYSEWRVVLGVCEWNFFFHVQSLGTGGTHVELTLPVPNLVEGTGSYLRHIGQAQIYDASTATRYSLDVESRTNDPGAMAFGGAATGNNLWGAIPNLAIDVGDQIRGMVRYRVE
jgi:hypothetical protein